MFAFGSRLGEIPLGRKVEEGEEVEEAEEAEEVEVEHVPKKAKPDVITIPAFVPPPPPLLTPPTVSTYSRSSLSSQPVTSTSTTTTTPFATVTAPVEQKERKVSTGALFDYCANANKRRDYKCDQNQVEFCTALR